MAGNKKVPLRWGFGGPVIGSAMIDENGLVMGEIEVKNPLTRTMLFGSTSEISIHTPDIQPDENIVRD